MSIYPEEIWLQGNLRLTEKRTVRKDARLQLRGKNPGPTQRPNNSVPLSEWIREVVLQTENTTPEPFIFLAENGVQKQIQYDPSSTDLDAANTVHLGGDLIHHTAIDLSDFDSSSDNYYLAIRDVDESGDAKLSLLSTWNQGSAMPIATGVAGVSQIAPAASIFNQIYNSDLVNESYTSGETKWTTTASYIRNQETTDFGKSASTQHHARIDTNVATTEEPVVYIDAYSQRFNTVISQGYYFRSQIEVGQNGVTFNFREYTPGVPASFPDANGSYTFPTADGNAGEYLQTDGAGTLSWAAAAGLDTHMMSTNLTNSTGINRTHDSNGRSWGISNINALAMQGTGNSTFTFQGHTFTGSGGNYSILGHANYSNNSPDVTFGVVTDFAVNGNPSAINATTVEWLNMNDFSIEHSTVPSTGTLLFDGNSNANWTVREYGVVNMSAITSFNVNGTTPIISLSSTNQTDIEADTLLNLVADTELRIQTPNIVAASGVENDQVLSLRDSSSGEAEYVRLHTQENLGDGSGGSQSLTIPAGSIQHIVWKTAATAGDTIQLPNPATTSTQLVVIIKDKGSDFGATNVDVTVTGGANVEGAATLTMSTTDMSLAFGHDGSNWYIIY